jgi:NADH-quinone oxidoreductase subunit C
MKQDAALNELAEYITAAIPGTADESHVAFGQLTLTCGADNIVQVLTFLRDDANTLFKILIDIAGVDWPERPNRFDVVYSLLSLSHNQRIRVKVQASEGVPVPSACGVFSAAGWYEREAWDLYGVLFSGHPDLRRILTDYGFDGHPLRKDFPLTGHVEVRYDDEKKRVVYEPVNLTQEFRSFDFMSPWEGARYILPEESVGGIGAGESGGGTKKD